MKRMAEKRKRNVKAGNRKKLKNERKKQRILHRKYKN